MNAYNIDIYRDIGLEELFPQFNKIDACYDRFSPNKLEVNFENCRYISPSSLLVLTSYLKHKSMESLSLDISIKKNSAIENYISRVDFYKTIGIDKEERFTRHDEKGRFTTIKNITEENYQIINEIMDILVTHECVTDEVYYSMDWSFNELLDNVFQHSESITGGFLIAQSYDDRVEFCVVDNGLGIQGSLRQNSKFERLNSLECLIRSTEKKVTVGTGQGNGLYITRRFIEQNQGEMHIYSNNGYISIKNGQLISKELNYGWGGTIIMLNIKKDSNLDISEVFEEAIPVSYLDRKFEKNPLLW